MAFNPSIKRKEEKYRDIDTRISSFLEAKIPLKKEEIYEQCQRCLQCPNPTCEKGCPLHLPIKSFIKALFDNDEDKAFELINGVTPISLICSIVCDYSSQCEGNCIRAKRNEAVKIGAIHRYIASLEKPLNPKKKAVNSKKIAVIGAGPSGLALAYKLYEEGYQITVYEREKEIGGVPHYSIPEFRLTNEDLRKAFRIFKETDIEFKLGIEVSLNEIIDEYDVVYIATGTQKSKYMGIPGEDLPGVITSEEFLKDIKLNKGLEKYKDYNHVFVVGGGNVAMDVSRTLLRLGKKPTIVYRRSIEEAPCRKDEIIEAQEEGVNFAFLNNPVEYIGEDKLTQLKLIKMELGEPDESGRRSPQEVKDSEYMVDADLVVLAIGSSLENKYISDIELKRNLIITNNYQTSNPKVFAGGDAVTGPNTVVHAVKAGLDAAIEITNYLEK